MTECQKDSTECCCCCCLLLQQSESPHCLLLLQLRRRSGGSRAHSPKNSNMFEKFRNHVMRNSRLIFDQFDGDTADIGSSLLSVVLSQYRSR